MLLLISRGSPVNKVQSSQIYTCLDFGFINVFFQLWVEFKALNLVSKMEVCPNIQNPSPIQSYVSFMFRLANSIVCEEIP